jgi:hypothetical protein
MKNNDLLKSSETLRDALKDRWKKLGLTQLAVVKDANERKINMTKEALNKYINRPYSLGALNQQQITWLAWRYDIPVFLKVGEPSDKNVKYTINEYDELRALKRLAKVYPPEHEIYKKNV